MKMRRALIAAGLVFGIAATQPAHALTFNDNFDSYPIGVPTIGSLSSTWNVIGPGNVDVIGIGSGWDLLPGNGRYIDLAGTPGPGGIETINTFSTGSYHLEFWLAGSQRSDSAPNAVTVKFGDWTVTIDPPSTFAPFTLYSYDISAAAMGAVPASLSFLAGGPFPDNVGPLLDNVSLVSTPLPAALPLYATGLGLMGVVAWRRRRKAAAQAA